LSNADADAPLFIHQFNAATFAPSILTGLSPITLSWANRKRLI
jgi:hypothetical protein